MKVGWGKVVEGLNIRVKLSDVGEPWSGVLFRRVHLRTVYEMG